MNAYDLRTLFPLKDAIFNVEGAKWLCRLAEVSDLHPEVDRISWYVVFERGINNANDRPLEIRKLEIVTSAKQVLGHGFEKDLHARLQRWLQTGETEARVEWLKG